MSKEITSKPGKPIYLKDDEFIKNPFAIVKTLGNFSVSQTNIIMTLIANLQERINDYAAQRKLPSRQLNLFADMEFTEGKLQFPIPLKDLGIRPQGYIDLEDACKRLSSVLVPVRSLGKDGVGYHTMMQMIKCWMPETATTQTGKPVKFQRGTRRTGKLIIEIEKPIADTYFTNSFGYVNQLYKLARQCKCSKTFPMYSMISRYKDKDMGGGDFEIKYSELKKNMGVLTFKPGTTIVEVDTYPKLKDFKRRVLDPAEKELKRLFEEGKSDLYFDYELVYEDRPEKGNPDKVHFYTHFAVEAEATEIANSESETVEPQVSGMETRMQYLEDIRKAVHGDEQMRALYPNWEYLASINHIE